MNRPLPLLLITGIAFGCNFPLGKLATQAGVDPALWAIVICLGAGLALLAVATVFETSPVFRASIAMRRSRASSRM